MPNEVPATANPFSLAGRVAVVTGGYGVLGGTMASGLAGAGARVAILGRNRDRAEAKCRELREQGAEAMTIIADVLDEDSLRAARDELLAAWGQVDILLNAAGGNVAPSLVFGEAMANTGHGSIVNISSMAAMQAISGVLGYSVAKAAVENATKWLAVDLARRCSPSLRVNAIAPGFFVAEQNRAVLINADGSYTDRAKTIINRTPVGRFGRPDELVGAVVYLCSDAASFVTGVVIPVDGGFSAYSGV